MSTKSRYEKLQEDLQLWQDHPMGTAMAIQRLAREVAELREINDTLLRACELSLEWLDEVCNPENEDMRTTDGIAAYNRIKDAIKKSNETN